MRRLEPSQLDEVVALLAAGEVVAIPTDTVYGLAARLDDPAALRRLRAAKGRPDGRPLPVLVSSAEQAAALLGGLDPLAEQLLSRWWPGALTVVLACEPGLAEAVDAADASVGLRCPDDALAIALLERTGPLCVSSANRSGEPPCEDADEVVAELGSSGRVLAVLDDGPRSGQPSTVVALRGEELVILREGPVDPTLS